MIKTVQLSQHFTLAEFTRSATAIERGIQNVPSDIHIRNMELLCDNIFEPVRSHFKLPVTILSGFRSLDLNRALGGAKDSQHLFGEAGDAEIYGVRNDDLYNFIKDNLSFDQLIAEQLDSEDGSAGWIHVSYRLGRNRGETLSFLGKGRGYVEGLVYA